MRRAYGIGETVYDIIFKEDQPLSAVPGGSAFNSIISLGRSGIPTSFIGQVGDDHVGQLMVNFLQDNNVDATYVNIQQNTKSHLSLAFLNEQNDAQYQFYKDHNSVQLGDALPQLQQGDVVLFGSFFAINPLIRPQVRKFLSMAKANGAIIYYDINFRKPHIADLDRTMQNIIENYGFADVVRGSTEDFGNMIGITDAQQIYHEHLSKYCPNFICTDGAGSIKVITPNFQATYPVKKIETVSTIGAGDSFNAGFVHGLIKEDISKQQFAQLDEAQWAKLVAYGQAFSSRVCQSIYNYVEKGFVPLE